MRALVAAVVVVVAGCAGSSPPSPARVVGPPIDKDVAEEDARGTLAEIYAAIQRGKPDNLFSVVDEAVRVFGPRRADALASRTDALVALGAVVEAGESSKLRSGALSVVPARRGRSAWAVDVVNVEGKPLAVTAILSSEDEFFRVTVAALAWTPPARELRPALDEIAVVPPGATSPGRIAPGAEGAVERFRSGLLDPARWGDDLARDDEAVYVGPSAGELARGKKQLARLWEKRVAAETRAAVSGEIDAGITADGQLAWVTAPVTRVEKDRPPLPLRVFAVFERDGDEWTLAALHEALAIDAPGAGGPFVKIVPPPPAPPEPAPAADDDDEANEAKAKKTKKKAKTKATKAKAKKKSKKKRKRKRNKKRRLSDDD